jgi:hypothetical protein
VRFVLAMALLVSLAGCKTPEACRPDTLFLKLALPGDVNRIGVSVFLEGMTLTATVDYQGGDTLEVELPPGRYLSGAPITITIRALHGEDELARQERMFELPQGCAALELNLSQEMGAGADGGGDGATGADALKPNGTTCGSGGECASTFCVDGYCCNATCSGQCEACDVATLNGVCAPVVGAQPHGTRTPCAGSGTVCGGICGGQVRTACSYPSPVVSCRVQSCPVGGNTKTRAAGCDGAGACPPAETDMCAQGCASGTNDCLGACMNDGECSAADPTKPFCDAGTCTPKKPRGRACGAGSECTSTFCADGVCCNSACGSQCDSCKESGSMGICLRVVGDPRSGGVPARSPCAGSGTCKGQCDGAAATCQNPGGSTACGSASCTDGLLTPVGACNGAGSCSQQSLVCGSNYCDTATTCGNCPSNAACGSTRWCDSGTCRDRSANGVACGIGSQCLSNICGAGPSGNICCAVTCTGQSKCDAAGTMCVCTPFCSSLCRSSSTPNGCGGTCPRNCTGCCNSPTECRTGQACD